MLKPVKILIPLGIGIDVLHKNRLPDFSGRFDLPAQQVAPPPRKITLPDLSSSIRSRRPAEQVVDKLLCFPFCQSDDLRRRVLILAAQDPVDLAFLQQNVQLGICFFAQMRL